MILVVDNYDSFTYNLVHYLAELGARTRVIRNDAMSVDEALATRPDLVFADEPTGNLDSRTGREVLSLLAAASTSYGQSIASSTSDVGGAQQRSALQSDTGRVRWD